MLLLFETKVLLVFAFGKPAPDLCFKFFPLFVLICMLWSGIDNPYDMSDDSTVRFSCSSGVVFHERKILQKQVAVSRGERIYFPVKYIFIKNKGIKKPRLAGPLVSLLLRSQHPHCRSWSSSVTSSHRYPGLHIHPHHVYHLPATDPGHTSF